MGRDLLLRNLQTEDLKMVSCRQDDTSHVLKIVSTCSNEDTFDHDAHNFLIREEFNLQRTNNLQSYWSDVSNEPWY
jgi:hypothetical protein